MVDLADIKISSNGYRKSPPQPKTISSDINGLLPLLQWLDHKLEEAIAPELDRRYEQLYAYLQDDVRRKRPTIDLALNLLCANPLARLSHCHHFTTDAPLIQNRLLQAIAPSEQSQPTLLALELHLDRQLINLLLNRPGLDPSLSVYAELAQPQASLEQLSLPSKIKEGLIRLIIEKSAIQQPLRLYFQGADRYGKRQTAEALARQAEVRLLAINLGQLMESKADFQETLSALFRAAWFQNAWLYLEDLDVLLDDKQHMGYQNLIAEVLAEVKTIAILSELQPSIPIHGSRAASEAFRAELARDGFQAID